MSKAYVIVNESHNLMEEQEKLLNEKFDEIEFVKVPANGWSLEDMEGIEQSLLVKMTNAEVRPGGKTVVYPANTGDNAVVFVSPIPYLLKELSINSFLDGKQLYEVLVFHNDRREKKELPNGKIIQVVAQTGWRLV